MKQIDQVYTDWPVYGSRKIAGELVRRLKQPVNRKRVRRLMKAMGIEAIYPKPNLSRSHPEHPIYPYLLKGVVAKYPDHIWGVDITYIPMHKGWLYLVAILDWYSRYIVAWELSDNLEAAFCAYALNQALNQAQPHIHNSDQGVQFTSAEYLAHLWQYHDIRISMDGRGRAFDNIFTERLWRTIKYEEVYLKDYSSPKEARESLNNYIYLYNHKRIHQSLNYYTPAEVYQKAVII
jgi:putative transposase